MTEAIHWAGPAVELATLGLLAAVLWRLGRTPGAAWAEREAALRAIFDDLRSLVAESEGLARDLDGRLAAREERLQGLVAAAEAVVAGRGRKGAGSAGREVGDAGQSSSSWVTGDDAAPASAGAAEIARRIEEMADAGESIDLIARRVGVAPAEVRLVLGLRSARAARRRSAAPEAAVHG